MINKTVLVYDNGLFVELAIRLARDFKRVLYYMPWKNAFPRLGSAQIGEGIEEIERVYDLWEHEDEVDLWIFPDVYDGDLQNFLRRDGRSVWGNGEAEFLELDRWHTRQLQKKLGITGPKTDRVVGINKLREYLRAHENRWLKVSTYRGDMETYHHEKYFTSAPFIDDLAHKLGAVQDEMEFILEENIDGVEIGYDGYSVDGTFPEIAAYGYEIKDLGYAGKVVPYASMPKQVLEVNSRLEPVLKEEGSRGFMSTEIRITKDGTAYLTDPCMRCGSPPTEAAMEIYANLGEIIAEGADGRLVTPKPLCKYFAMAMIHSSYATKHWVPIDLPAEARRWVKFRNLTVLNGHCYFVPQTVDLPEIGAVVGMGSSMKEAFAKVDAIAAELEGFQIEIHNDSLIKAEEVIEEGKKVGIEF